MVDTTIERPGALAPTAAQAAPSDGVSRLRAVIKQILYACGSAESKVRAEQDAHVAHSAIVAVQNGLGQTEFRDTVAEDSSDFFAAFKYRDFVSPSCQNNGNRDAGWACTDNADFHAV